MVPIGVGLAFSIAAGAQAKGSQAAGLRGNPASFFGPDAYPVEAIRKREQGRVVTRLTVSPDGRVTDCDIRETSGSTALDVRTCVIAVGKIVFTAARDEAGRPIASTYILPVRWVLPEPVLLARRSLEQRLTLTLSADDRLETCRTFEKERLADCPVGLRADWTRGSERVARLRSFAGPGRLALSMQHILQFADEPVIPEAQLQPGQTVIALRRTAFEIGPDGQLVDEQVVEQAGPQDTSPPLAQSLGPFERAQRSDHVLYLDVASYAKLP